MLHRHPPALPKLRPLTRSLNLGPRLHHLPPQGPRAKTSRKSLAQMANSFPKKKNTASASDSASYAAQRLTCRISAPLARSSRKVALLIWTPSLSNRQMWIPPLKLSLQILRTEELPPLTHRLTIAHPPRQFWHITRKSHSMPSPSQLLPLYLST